MTRPRLHVEPHLALHHTDAALVLAVEAPPSWTEAER